MVELTKSIMQSLRAHEILVLNAQTNLVKCARALLNKCIIKKVYMYLLCNSMVKFLYKVYIKSTNIINIGLNRMRKENSLNCHFYELQTNRQTAGTYALKADGGHAITFSRTCEVGILHLAFHMSFCCAAAAVAKRLNTHLNRGFLLATAPRVSRACNYSHIIDF